MRVHFSTDDFPPRDREQFWLDFVAKHVVHVTPGDRADPATFRAQLDAQVAGRFTSFDFRTSHRNSGRTAADVSKDNGFFHLRRVMGEQIYSAAPTRAMTVERCREPSIQAPRSPEQSLRQVTSHLAQWA